nr:ORF1 protein [Ipomoea batatas]GMD48455.1 ORF1 protein [Ipomoea batatas]
MSERWEKSLQDWYDSRRSHLEYLDLDSVKKGLEALTEEFLSSRPLTAKEVKELVVEIAEQPKLVEQEALKLTEELKGKLDKVEGLIKDLKEFITG